LLRNHRVTCSPGSPERLFGLARDGNTDERGMPDPTLMIELLREFPREIAPLDHLRPG
jgi:hypothetical protein